MDTTEAGRYTVTEPVSFKSCQDLAKAVRYCSRSLIEGSWIEKSTARGRRPLFRPADFESAKAFLKASVEVIDKRRPHRSVSDTPVSSRTVPAEEEMPVCHGCHGRIGQTQHQGSAIGKDLCIFQHSFYCRGGVIEDITWRACPPDYVFDPNVDLAAGPGFENTLGSTNFLPPSQVQGGPAYSTPLLQDVQHHPVLQPSPETFVEPSQWENPRQDSQHLGAVPRQEGVDRVPGMVHIEGGRRNLSSEYPQVPDHSLPETIQDKINEHRSSNQAAAAAASAERPSEVDITHLRKDPDLQVEVASIIEDVIRKNIPSLSAADSAAPPHGGAGFDQGHHILRSTSSQCLPVLVKL